MEMIKIVKKLGLNWSTPNSENDESPKINVLQLPLEIWIYYILPQMNVEEVQKLREVCKYWFEMVTIYWNNNGKQNKLKKYA